ncbi:DUF6230 family protein [Streptantibioticus cattleyicolor]|nr:DUF6230 family protein [Streptantibioticus cattleyicolor]CCB71441.1 conserved exported protein of unknown function [Streptantibioticus cattleyicolor NRRL 8057 = DSM 46488]
MTSRTATPTAGTGRTGPHPSTPARTNWRRFAMVAPVTLALAAGTVWASTAVGAPVSFAVSGSTFQVAADHLTGTGAVQFAAFAQDNSGKQRPVAVAGVNHARIYRMCQSSVARTPFGSVTLRIRSVGDNPVEADHLVIDLDRLEGRWRFGQVVMGRDAGRLDAVEGVHGLPGAYGQQAGTLEIDRMRLHAWSIAAGTFSLKNAGMSIEPGDHPCL